MNVKRGRTARQGEGEGRLKKKGKEKNEKNKGDLEERKGTEASVDGDLQGEGIGGKRVVEESRDLRGEECGGEECQT